MQIGIPEIDRKYEILDMLGEGGMGAIYRARHRYLDEIRVIKTIRPQLRSNPDMQGRFLQEAKVAAKLSHPHIASIYDFTMTEDGLACIVMEHIDGRNLREIQREHGNLTAIQTQMIARQVLDALGYLHARQFVHRDISTDNLMLGVDDTGRPKVTLIDLGLAKSLEAPEHHTTTGMVVGKVRYIAPEQLSSGAADSVVDGRCDLYAFGVVLYELMTSKLPIVGDDAVSLIAGHLSRPPVSFDETDPTGAVPIGLRQVVMKSLAKKPDDRYASAADMAAAIDSALVSADGDESAFDLEQQTSLMSSSAIQAVDRAAASGTPFGSAPAQDSAPASVAPGPGGATVVADRKAWRLPSALSGKRLLIGALAAAAAVSLVFLLPMIQGRGEGASAGGIVAESGRGAGRGEALAADAIFYGQSHALLIGNNAYQSLPLLETAVNDVRAVGAVLERQFGFSVTLLENATRKEMIDALSNLLGSLTSRDNLLVYYAGHGNIEFGRESWQPVDAAPDDTTQWISTQYEISTPMKDASVRHVLVISDSCYAGASTIDSTFDPSAERGQPADVLAGRVSRMVLTSGGLSPVLDQGDGHLSIFARAFLEALDESTEIRSTSDLFLALRPKVIASAQAYQFDQAPTLAPIPRAGDEGGELFFVPSS